MGWTNYYSDGSLVSRPAASAQYVSTLPSAPYDGQEVYYQNTSALVDGTNTMATLGVIWHLRYRSSTNTYKWEFIGGGTLHTHWYGQSLAANFPTQTLTIPLSGEYIFSAGFIAQGSQTLAWAARTTFGDVGYSANPFGQSQPWVSTGTASNYARHTAYNQVRTTFSAGNITTNVLDANGSGANGPTFYELWMTASPVRIG